jgi:mRNA interferase MazF
MRRGEIWWATLRSPTGSEPAGRRPFLVVSNDSFNASAIQTVTCLALTSNLTRAAAPGNVRLSRRASRLPRESVANVSQVVTLDKNALENRVGVIPPTIMREIDGGLRLALGL